MRRLLSLLLIPFVAFGQATWLAHSHDGVESETHSSRPHFHLAESEHGHEHHHHDHQSDFPSLEDGVDHESPSLSWNCESKESGEAVYCSISSAPNLSARKSLGDSLIESSWCSNGMHGTEWLAMAGAYRRANSDPPCVRPSDSPLFLLHLSLRI